MKIGQKIIISLIIVGLLVLGFAVFIIQPLISQIRKESNDFIFQKNQLAELEARIQNLKKFQQKYPLYQENLARINTLFINPAEPINFIEFLEKTAFNSQLSIEILPFSPAKLEDDPWPSINFRLSLVGYPSNFLKFLEKLESAPYLIEILNLDIERVAEDEEDEEDEEDVRANLLIKVYTSNENSNQNRDQ